MAGVSRVKRTPVCQVWHITQAAMPGTVPPRSVMNTRSTVARYRSISADDGAGACARTECNEADASSIASATNRRATMTTS